MSKSAQSDIATIDSDGGQQSNSRWLLERDCDCGEADGGNTGDGGAVASREAGQETALAIGACSTAAGEPGEVSAAGERCLLDGGCPSSTISNVAAGAVGTAAEVDGLVVGVGPNNNNSLRPNGVIGERANGSRDGWPWVSSTFAAVTGRAVGCCGCCRSVHRAGQPKGTVVTSCVAPFSTIPADGASCAARATGSGIVRVDGSASF